ncbi:uncharacterized protein LOC106467830 isoform X2 [Limulus polyphemus]|uniref:Uncharacterized protein LOC106467830 isoform X2 n=1 Tax=Limulus polyphemus TaxID=6850 RepID=A0ABM1T778_LIMPO|nr:uncharacterized protein LOC106467830 isoform X2 [Limulus polyphemus]
MNIAVSDEQSRSKYFTKDDGTAVHSQSRSSPTYEGFDSNVETSSWSDVRVNDISVDIFNTDSQDDKMTEPYVSEDECTRLEEVYNETSCHEINANETTVLSSDVYKSVLSTLKEVNEMHHLKDQHIFFSKTNINDKMKKQYVFEDDDTRLAEVDNETGCHEEFCKTNVSDKMKKQYVFEDEDTQLAEDDNETGCHEEFCKTNVSDKMKKQYVFEDDDTQLAEVDNETACHEENGNETRVLSSDICNSDFSALREVNKPHHLKLTDQDRVFSKTNIDSYSFPKEVYQQSLLNKILSNEKNCKISVTNNTFRPNQTVNGENDDKCTSIISTTRNVFNKISESNTSPEINTENETFSSVKNKVGFKDNDFHLKRNSVEKFFSQRFVLKKDEERIINVNNDVLDKDFKGVTSLQQLTKKEKFCKAEDDEVNQKSDPTTIKYSLQIERESSRVAQENIIEEISGKHMNCYKCGEHFISEEYRNMCTKCQAKTLQATLVNTEYKQAPTHSPKLQAHLLVDEKSQDEATGSVFKENSRRKRTLNNEYFSCSEDIVSLSPDQMVKRRCLDNTGLNGSKFKHQSKPMPKIKKDNLLIKYLLSTNQHERNTSGKLLKPYEISESENRIEPENCENLQATHLVENNYKQEENKIHPRQLVESNVVSDNNLTNKQREKPQMQKVTDTSNCKLTRTNKNMRFVIKQVCSGLFLKRFDNDGGDFDDVIHASEKSSVESETQDVCVTFKEDGNEMETIMNTSMSDEKCIPMHTANVENIHNNFNGQSLKMGQKNCSKHNFVVKVNKTVEEKLKLEAVREEEIQSFETGNIGKKLCSYGGKQGVIKDFIHLNEKECLNSEKTISDHENPEVSQHVLKKETVKESQKCPVPPEKMDALKCIESKSIYEEPELHVENSSFEKCPAPPEKMDVLKCIKPKSITEEPELHDPNSSFEKEETKRKIQEKIISFLKESSKSVTPIDELDWLAGASIIDLNCGPTQAINLFTNKLQKNFEDLKKFAIAQEDIPEITEDLLEEKNHLLSQIKKQVLSLRLLKSTADYQSSTVQCASKNEDDTYRNSGITNKYMDGISPTESGSSSKSVNVDLHSSLGVNMENHNLSQDPSSSSPHLQNNYVISKALCNSDTSDCFGNTLVSLASNTSRMNYSNYQDRFQLLRKVAENFQDAGMSVNLTQNSRLNEAFDYQPSSLVPVQKQHHQTLAQDTMQLLQPVESFDYQPSRLVPCQEKQQQMVISNNSQQQHYSKLFQLLSSQKRSVTSYLACKGNTGGVTSRREDTASREQLRQSDLTATSTLSEQCVLSMNPQSQQATIGIPSNMYYSFLNSANISKANIGQEQTASTTNRLLLNQHGHCSSWPALQTLDKIFHQRTINSSRNSASPGSECTSVSSRTSAEMCSSPILESELRNGHLNNNFDVLLMSPIHQNLNERTEETRQKGPRSALAYIPQLQRRAVHQNHPYNYPQDFSKTGDRANIPGSYSPSNRFVNQQVRTSGRSLTHQPWNDLSHFRTFERVPNEYSQTSTTPNPEINRSPQNVSAKCNLCEKTAKYQCTGCHSAKYCGQSCAVCIIFHGSLFDLHVKSFGESSVPVFWFYFHPLLYTNILNRETLLRTSTETCKSTYTLHFKYSLVTVVLLLHLLSLMIGYSTAFWKTGKDLLTIRCNLA